VRLFVWWGPSIEVAVGFIWIARMPGDKINGNPVGKSAVALLTANYLARWVNSM